MGSENLCRDLVVVEQLLRGNAFEPEKWLEKLPLAVYNLNATRNLTLGVSPIEAERGYQPRQPLDLEHRQYVRSSGATGGYLVG